MAHTTRFQVETSGETDVIDITAEVERELAKGPIHNGLVCIFVVGSTASISTTEAEPGLLTHDLKTFFERIAPADLYYKHEETWNDDNGHSHVRATTLGPSITVPLIDGRLALGRWQQIVLLDFDTRPRKREIIVTTIG